MSGLGRIGIWSMELRMGMADEIAAAAAELDGLGYPALWIPGLSGEGGLQSGGGVVRAVGAAAQLDGLGYPSLWIPGLSGQGAMQRVGELLGASKRATIATGVLGHALH